MEHFVDLAGRHCHFFLQMLSNADGYERRSERVQQESELELVMDEILLEP